MNSSIGASGVGVYNLIRVLTSIKACFRVLNIKLLIAKLVCRNSMKWHDCRNSCRRGTSLIFKPMSQLLNLLTCHVAKLQQLLSLTRAGWERLSCALVNLKIRFLNRMGKKILFERNCVWCVRVRVCLPWDWKRETGIEMAHLRVSVSVCLERERERESERDNEWKYQHINSNQKYSNWKFLKKTEKRKRFCSKKIPTKNLITDRI